MSHLDFLVFLFVVYSIGAFSGYLATDARLNVHYLDKGLTAWTHAVRP